MRPWTRVRQPDGESGPVLEGGAGSARSPTVEGRRRTRTRLDEVLRLEEGKASYWERWRPRRHGKKEDEEKKPRPQLGSSRATGKLWGGNTFSRQPDAEVARGDSLENSSGRGETETRLDEARPKLVWTRRVARKLVWTRRDRNSSGRGDFNLGNLWLCLSRDGVRKSLEFLRFDVQTMSEPIDQESALDLLRANIASCRADIAEAARRAGRDPSEIMLLPVTKYLPADVFRLLHRLGLSTFGESRVQRVIALRDELTDLPDIEWHLIGHLQRNKVARALQLFVSIHSVDSLRLARELVSQASARQSPLPPLYVEVNVSREARKTGLPEDEVASILEFFATDEELRKLSPGSLVSGLMTMAPYGADPDEARPHFRRLRELRDAYVQRGLLCAGAGLSMGMSGDFQVAIEEGATVVRVGTGLYSGVLPGE